MTTPDRILNAVCEVMELESDKVLSKRRINETYQMARVVFCRIAYEHSIPTNGICTKINRCPQNVHHNIYKGKGAGWEYENTMREVRKRI